MNVGEYDIYDLADRWGMTPSQIRREVTWADIRRIKEQRKVREQNAAWRDNLRFSMICRRISSAIKRQPDSFEDGVKGGASALFQLQYPDKTEKKGGMTVVTYKQLEARGLKVETQNRAALGAIMQSNGGK